MVLCLALVVAGLAGGAEYVHYLGDVPARVWAVVLGLAAFFAVLLISSHYWPKLALILYGAWLVFNVVVGVATRDEVTISLLWQLAFFGILIVLPLYIVKQRKRRRPPSPPPAQRRLSG